MGVGVELVDGGLEVSAEEGEDGVVDQDSFGGHADLPALGWATGALV